MRTREEVEETSLNAEEDIEETPADVVQEVHEKRIFLFIETLRGSI
jgi:hypothetical protein